MPITFPAHAAAILPFLGGRLRVLPPVALAVGTVIPDVAYVVQDGGRSTHNLGGLLWVSLPLGLLLYVGFERFVLPVLARGLPRVGKCELGRFAMTRGLATGVRSWSCAVAAILLGAVTHHAWDGITHAWMWPARELFPEATLSVGGRR